MSIRSVLLASGAGWRVEDVRCAYGPRDRPFQEQHQAISIAIVTGGTFSYHTAQGRALLAPGAVLLGNHGQSFECGHEHGVGDRCLSFQLEPQWVESVIAELPGARKLAFTLPSLPPLPELIPILAQAYAARGEVGHVSFEELALAVVARVGSAVVKSNSITSSKQRSRASSRRDRQRVSEVLRRIESQSDQALSLNELARNVAMSPYHFLRTFRAVTGVTPHQFLLHTRLQRAATRLRSTNDPVSVIATDTGFGDVSTFNRRFRRLLGASPTSYRTGGRSSTSTAP